MLLQLIILENKVSSEGEQDVWREACQARGMELEIIDANGSEGKKLADALALSIFPALIIDGEIKVIGIPDKQMAGKVLDDALNNPEKRSVLSEN